MVRYVSVFGIPTDPTYDNKQQIKMKEPLHNQTKITDSGDRRKNENLIGLNKKSNFPDQNKEVD